MISTNTQAAVRSVTFSVLLYM